MMKLYPASSAGRRCFLGVVALCFGMTACDHPFKAVAPGRNVALETGVSAPARVEQGAIEMTVPVSIVNRGRSSVYVDPCTVSLERRYPAEWKQVWKAECADVESVRVEAGTTVEYEVLVRANPGGTHAVWREPVKGTYRVSVPVGVYGGSEKLKTVPVQSAPFELAGS